MIKTTGSQLLSVATLLLPGALMLGSTPTPSTMALAVTQSSAYECSPLAGAKDAIRLERVEKIARSNSEYRLFWSVLAPSIVPHQLQPEMGGEFYVVRCLPPGKWAVVGNGEVDSINGELVAANARRPENTGSEASQSGNEYDRPMTGDLVVPRQVSLEPLARVVPRLEYGVAEIFDRDDSNGWSFNLSAAGQNILRDSFQKFQKASGRLIVEGFANRNGSRDLLRIESQIRASAVARFLAREFALTESQVAAVGLGSSGLATGMTKLPVWPQAETTDGVVLRVIPR